MTDQQLIDYKSNPEAYFGRVEHVSKHVRSKYDVFEFFMECYKSLSREALLERLAGHPNYDTFGAMEHDDLLAQYCEGMAAASNLGD